MRALISQIIFERQERKSDGLGADYTKYYESQDIQLIPVSNFTTTITKYFSADINGIILSGGNDVSPALYNGDPQRSKNCYREMDDTHLRLIEEAMKREIPVFAECRGFQLLNVYFGGSLVQHISDDVSGALQHEKGQHPITITDEKFQRYLGEKKCMVNSYHHQGMLEENLCKELLPFAAASDGVIEGLYHPRYPMYGVMWHPEKIHEGQNISDRLISLFKQGKVL